MNSFQIQIDGRAVTVFPEQSVLDAARFLGIDIPTLCYLEKCGPLNSCLACLVKINNKLVPACGTKVQPGMIVESETPEVRDARRTALELLFSDHVGDCLSPCQRLCPLQMNIPLMLRQIQAGGLGDAITTVREALPLPAVLGRLCHHPCEQGCRRGAWDAPAAIRDLERRVAEEDLASPQPHLPKVKSATGKNVVIIGAGPTGLSAAYYLLREGHACTITDRHDKAGGSLRHSLDEEILPPVILDAEIEHLQKLGAQFKLGISLGTEVSLEGLLRGFDAVLLTFGEINKAEVEALGLESSPAGIKTDPETFQTHRPAVFAAGRAVRRINQLVRAMSEGRAAAECIHRFLSGQKIQRAEKPFSCTMGRLDKEELNLFLQEADLVSRAESEEICSNISCKEAVTEASRCLHCDCRSAGSCALQFYAKAYGVDTAHYRQHRPKFEQHVQPGGVIFEPGKCILCGICIKLTELAAEPLGLTFIRRGFEMRVAAPFDHTIAEGLQKVAAECVQNCPTGALTFSATSCAKKDRRLAMDA